MRPEKPPATRLGDWTATVDLTIVSTRLTVDHVARGGTGKVGDNHRAVTPIIPLDTETRTFSGKDAQCL